ncbi:hypothetical protein CTZ27_29795 [Streptomyces griseocarneus]|nr:hypothetical protein CTZ27_29795 [Streptomyces griseocarneus]
MMSDMVPGAAPVNRNLKILLAVVASLAVAALVAVGVIAAQHHSDRDEAKGVSGSGTIDGKATSISTKDLSQLAQDRTRALVTGDEDAFVAVFADDVKDQQRRVFRNLRRVPLDWDTAGFRVVTSSGRQSSVLGGSLETQVDVSFDHRISGVDVAPVSEGYRWTVRRTSASAKPVVTKVAGTPYAKSFSTDADATVAYPAPWDLYDDLAVEKAGSVVLMAEASHARELHQAQSPLRAAGDKVLALWKTDGPGGRTASPGFAFVYEPDAKKFADMYGRGGQDRGEDGITVPMISTVRAEPSVAGARVVSRVTTPRVGQHEMVHALLEPLTGRSAVGSLDGPQPWLVEGVAEYVASTGADDRGAHAALQRVGFTGRLPEQITFYSKDATQQSAHYELGRLAVEHMADRYGKKKMLAFAAVQYSQPSGLDEQLREATGLDKAAFEAQWAEYVRGTLR